MDTNSRLIVAADFEPDPSKGQGSSWVRDQVLSLVDQLGGTGVYLKVNSALRLWGYGLINDIHGGGLKVFADLKLFDIGATLETDGALIAEYQPELLTVVCSAGREALAKLVRTLPNTEVLGVTVLTSLNEVDVQSMHGQTIDEAVRMFVNIASSANLGGLTSSPKEIQLVQKLLSDKASAMTINTPGVRPSWSVVAGDDQNPDRVMTPAKAIAAGATRIVVGRPITQANSPLDAVLRTIEEIHTALA
jgi:orotidine-5'-phosphate decarboxylase